MITDTQFSKWAQSPTKTPVLLVEITHKTGKVYLSDRMYCTSAGETPEHVSYDVCLNQAVMVEKTLGQDSLGAVRVFNDGSLDDFRSYTWVGYAIEIFVGDKSWARNDFRRQYKGLVEEFAELSASSFEFKSSVTTVISNEELLTNNSPTMAGNHTNTPALYVGDFSGAKCWQIAHPSLFDRNDVVVSYGGIDRDITWDDTTPIGSKRGTFTVDDFPGSYAALTFSCLGSIEKFKELFEFACNKVGQLFNADNLAAYPINPDVTFYINESMRFDEFLNITLETVGALLHVNDADEIELYQKTIPSTLDPDIIKSWITPADNPNIKVITVESPAASVRVYNSDYNHSTVTTPQHTEYNTVDLSAPYRVFSTTSYAADSEAITETRRLADLLSTSKRTYSITLDRISPELHVGAIVNIYSPSDRWGSSSEGLNALVVSTTQLYKSNKSELIVWR